MDGSIIEEVKPTRTETRTSRGTGGTGNTTSSSSTNTGTRTGGTGGTGTGRTGGKTGGEKEVVSTMADVEEEKRLERKRKWRERYSK